MLQRDTIHLDKTAPKIPLSSISGRVSNRRTPSKPKPRKRNDRFRLKLIFKILTWVVVPISIISIFYIAPSLGFSSQVRYRLIWIMISLGYYALAAFAYLLARWYRQDQSANWRATHHSNEEQMGLSLSARCRNRK